MKSIALLLTVVLTLYCSIANAEIEIYKDYKPSEEVYSVTTVKVDSNMGEVYLEGLINTYKVSLDAEKKLGHIKDYAMYWSDMPEGGDFNMMLVITFENTAAMAPSKEKYDAFIAEMTKKKADESTEFARKNYPSIRTITGQYNFRKIEILK
jgi:hypothetical protein